MFPDERPTRGEQAQPDVPLGTGGKILLILIILGFLIMLASVLR